MTEQTEPKKTRIKSLKSSEYEIIGRDKTNPGPHQNISVIPSPETNIYIAGTKCEHGGYIPATHDDPNRAPYCSLCYPYIIRKVGNEQVS